MEKITCNHCVLGTKRKILAEKDEHGNIFIMCKRCKKKIKIEFPDK